jgi:hypothetical protein
MKVDMASSVQTLTALIGALVVLSCVYVLTLKLL